MNYGADYEWDLEEHIRIVRAYRARASVQSHLVDSLPTELSGVDIVKPLDFKSARLKLNLATLARDILRAAARHPTDTPLNAHLDVLRKAITAVDSNSDLETFRWDLVETFARDSSDVTRPPVDPVPLQAPSSIYISSASPSPYLSPYPLSAKLSSGLAGSAAAPLPKSKISTPVTNGLQPKQASTSKLSVSVPQASTPNIPVPQSPVPQSSGNTVSVSVPNIPQKASPQKLPSKASTTTHTALPRQLIALQSPAKKLPEPIVVIPTSPHSSMLARKGGRPRKSEKTPAVPPPNYQIFDCQWKDCPAQLHNLPALEKHLRKVHLINEFMCGWKDCKDTSGMAFAQMVVHVQEKHLTPLAWTLGDGPVATASESGNGSFGLSDKNARPESLVVPADVSNIQAFARVRGIGTWREKALEVKRGGIAWKEESGPDCDISDRRLATPSRLVMAGSADEIAYTMD